MVSCEKYAQGLMEFREGRAASSWVKGTGEVEKRPSHAVRRAHTRYRDRQSPAWQRILEHPA